MCAQNTAAAPLACGRRLGWSVWKGPHWQDSVIKVIITHHQNPKRPGWMCLSSPSTHTHAHARTENGHASPSKRRLTKTGRLNNTFITFRGAGGQVHVKSITSRVSSNQLISPHARHTLLEIYAEDVLIWLLLPFSQAHKQGRRIARQRRKTTSSPSPSSTSSSASSLPHKTK